MIRVTVLELPASWGQPARVLADVDERLARGAETDLAILPEAALTGYVSPEGSFDLAPFAESIDGPTARGASALAARHGVHLLVPLVLREGEACFNAVVLFDSLGEIGAIYKKRHPWFPETWATAGSDSPPVVRVGDVDVTIAVCFDVHFLADDAADSLRASDLLLFPSAWVDDEEDSRVPLLRDLAKRFGIAIAAANWAPGDVRVKGQGGSCILDAHGDLVARAEDGRADGRVRRVR